MLHTIRLYLAKHHQRLRSSKIMTGKHYPCPYNIPVYTLPRPPMGRPNEGLAFDDPIRLTLRQVPLDDGAHDKGGAYWGEPSDLWCAWSEDHYIVRWMRAPRRAIAVAKVLEDFPSAEIGV